MAAAVASSNSHRSSIVTPRSPVVPLTTFSSSRVHVNLNPACVPSPAEVKKEAADRQAARQQRYRSRDEEKRRPSPQVRRRRRDDGDARDVSPERKRRRESVSYHRDVGRGSSSVRPPSTTTGARAHRRRDRDDSHRRDRDDAYRAAKKQENDRDRNREDMTRKSVSGVSRSEQRARSTGRPSATQQHQFPTAVDDRKPTPEKVKTTAEDEAEVKRRTEIQRQREEARRAMDKMVKTVEFNDPFISPMYVLKPLC